MYQNPCFPTFVGTLWVDSGASFSWLGWVLRRGKCFESYGERHSHSPCLVLKAMCAWREAKKDCVLVSPSGGGISRGVLGGGGLSVPGAPGPGCHAFHSVVFMPCLLTHLSTGCLCADTGGSMPGHLDYVYRGGSKSACQWSA